MKIYRVRIPQLINSCSGFCLFDSAFLCVVIVPGYICSCVPAPQLQNDKRVGEARSVYSHLDAYSIKSH